MAFDLVLTVLSMMGNRGSIYLITGRQTINTMADKIFKEYQEQGAKGELLFRRWPLRAVCAPIIILRVAMSQIVLSTSGIAQM